MARSTTNPLNVRWSSASKHFIIRKILVAIDNPSILRPPMARYCYTAHTKGASIPLEASRASTGWTTTEGMCELDIAVGMGRHDCAIDSNSIVILQLTRSMMIYFKVFELPKKIRVSLSFLIVSEVICVITQGGVRRMRGKYALWRAQIVDCKFR